MWFLLFVEAFAAFIVACADAVGDDHHTVRERVVRAVLWPATLWVWFTRREMPKLARFGAIVWLFLTVGWLISLESDRVDTMWLFLVVAEATLAFVVYCVDALSLDLQHAKLRRVARGIFWPVPLVQYLRDRESIRMIQASVTVWGLLTTGWLLSLGIDRVAQPMGWVH